jgi:eukaryotic-like serine/threonine-protein kinase
LPAAGHIVLVHSETFVTAADSPRFDIINDRYELERELGRGGMATVYLARDRKHDRRVAIKVLHPELAAVLGTERFVQEIRVIAALQHPHIVGLIDSGIFGPDAGRLARRPYYVMPYIEGESLRQKLERERQLSVRDAVRTAGEVASALDYAHRHGVIHRDIKPENILLHDGSALVSDFGIALAVQQAGGERMTQTGLSLGTPQYMSPEQAMGERSITARSDVYALGAVTYEMLAGEPPFSGPTVQAIVARLMAEAPRPLSVLRKTVPAHVEAAVLQALEKLPADRFSSAAEFASALTNHAFAPKPAIAESFPRIHTRSWVTAWLPWVLLLAALGFIAFGMVRGNPVLARAPLYRFDVVLPENAALVTDVFSVMALSPDGTMLVYNGQDSTGERRLYLRPMDRLAPVAIPGSENGAAPFFSPDGRWLGFRLGTRLVRAPVSGGAPEAVCEVGDLVRATWLERNVIVFADRAGLRQCSMRGEVTTLLASGPGELFSLPQGLPGDRGVLFGIQQDSTTRLVALDLRTQRIKELKVAGRDPRYVETGHLVYVSPDGLVRAVRFDARTMATAGEPVIVGEGIRIELGGAVMALSRTGTIVTPGITAQRVLEAVDRSGRAERLSARVAEFGDPSVSPDGRRVAVRLGPDIWLFHRTQRALTRLSFDSAASRPVWSADGRRVAYIRQIGTDVDLRWIGADGSAPAESLLSLPDLEIWEGLFTPDGRSLLVRTVGGRGSRDISLVPLDSKRSLIPLLQSPADEVAPAISPDGRWLAYVSNESGRAEVYVRSFPRMAGRTQISVDGGTEPVWSPRGGELFYRNRRLMLSAELRLGATAEIVHRAVLFSNPEYATDLTHRSYDIMPGGRHFLMVRNLAGPSHLTVTLNRFLNLDLAPLPFGQR